MAAQRDCSKLLDELGRVAVVARRAGTGRRARFMDQPALSCRATYLTTAGFRAPREAKSDTQG